MTERKVINLAERKRARLLPQVKTSSQLDEAVLETVPDFIDPPTIEKMSDEQLDSMLNVIRLNRLSATLIYKKTLEEKQKVLDEKLQAQIEKKCGQVCTELERVLKNEEKLELRINELRALRLQSGLGFNPDAELETIGEDDDVSRDVE